MMSTGCGVFTFLVERAGYRVEDAYWWDGVEGYVDGAGDRFMFKYPTRIMVSKRFLYEHSRGSAWLSVTKEELVRSAVSRGGQNLDPWDASHGDTSIVGDTTCHFVEEFPRGVISRRPRWDPGQMWRMTVIQCEAPGDMPDGAYLGEWRIRDPQYPERHCPSRYLLKLDVTGGKGKDVYAISPVPREYRTPAGQAAQYLRPVAVVADVVTFPLQLLVALFVPPRGGS
jgi:hypothetical protein